MLNDVQLGTDVFTPSRTGHRDAAAWCLARGQGLNSSGCPYCSRPSARVSHLLGTCLRHLLIRFHTHSSCNTCTYTSVIISILSNCKVRCLWKKLAKHHENIHSTLWLKIFSHIGENSNLSFTLARFILFKLALFGLSLTHGQPF